MMKIASVVIFLSLMIWTWGLIHNANAVSLDTHSGIQMQMSALIEKSILSKKPTAENIRIIKLWTENEGENKVKAVFTYKFNEKTAEGVLVENEISGSAILHREPSQQIGTDQWVLQNVSTTNDVIEFSEGTVLTPVADPSENNEPATNSEAAPAAPVHQAPVHGK